MSLNRKKTLLAAWGLLFLFAVPALGQGLADMQPFAPADMSTYGGGYRPNEGFFFSFDVLAWSIRSPKEAVIGFPDATRSVVLTATPAGGPVPPPDERNRFLQRNTHDTGALKSEFTWGQRYDIGYVHDHCGWLFSGFSLNDLNQKIYGSDVHVVFDDPPFGAIPKQHLQGFIDPDLTETDNLPVIFDTVEMQYATETWGVELNYLYRAHPFGRGGILELYFGARYFEFDEEFFVSARGGTLDDSFWENVAENHIVGPQLGGRWFRKCGRWTASTEGRFFAGFNRQNIHLRGQLGSHLRTTDPLDPPLELEINQMPPTSFNDTEYVDEWSPGVELRVDFKYQLTRSINARVGWTGFWIDGIARPANLINYEVPAMSIELADNRQWLFVHGVTFGMEVNH